MEKNNLACLKDAQEETVSVDLPYNMTFDYTETKYGVYVSLSGFTAGPPATIDSPQILTPFYNPTASFNGPSVMGLNYVAYVIAFLDTDKTPTLRLRGWVNSYTSENPEFKEISYDFNLKSTIENDDLAKDFMGDVEVEPA